MVKAFVALTAWLLIAFPLDAAQSRPETTRPVRPAWSELTTAQQTILAPLKPEWEQLDATRRRKWLEIAARYPRMKPQEQQRLQQRMNEWARLTPTQRKAARDRYLSIKKLPAGRRQEVTSEWERYQRSLVQQQRQQGAPLDPALTDAPEQPAAAPEPAADAVAETAPKSTIK